MTYSIRLDVSRLVETVNRQGLLFYPVMIYILTGIFSRLHGGQPQTAACYLPVGNGQKSLIWLKQDRPFETFFTDYARKCCLHYESPTPVPQGIPPQNCVYILLSGEEAPDVGAPCFYLCPFENNNSSVILPLSTNFTNEKLTSTELAALCQTACDSFAQS